MAIGKKIGNFAAKSTSITLSPGSGSMPNAQINYEGKVDGEVDATVYATMNFKSSDGKSGTYTLSSLLILSNGDVVGASGRGTTSYASDQSWNIAGVSDISDTSSMAVKGRIDLQSGTLNGELFERD